MNAQGNAGKTEWALVMGTTQDERKKVIKVTQDEMH